MTDPGADLNDRLAAAILEYLARNPNARDTARGIRDCWLPAGLQGASQEDVEGVLQQLVAEGRIGTISVLHNATLFTRVSCEPEPPRNPRPPPD